jgi:hypothetical protein
VWDSPQPGGTVMLGKTKTTMSIYGWALGPLCESALRENGVDKRRRLERLAKKEHPKLLKRMARWNRLRKWALMRPLPVPDLAQFTTQILNTEPRSSFDPECTDLDRKIGRITDAGELWFSQMRSLAVLAENHPDSVFQVELTLMRVIQNWAVEPVPTT